MIALLTVGGIGCRHSPHLARRLNDFEDVFTLTVGCGAGVKARFGPLHGGVLGNRDWLGLRGGVWFRDRFDGGHVEEVELLAWGEEAFSRGYFRDKSYEFIPIDILFMPHGGSHNESGLIPFVNLPETRLTRRHNGVPLSYYTQCELVAGLEATVRLGMNPGELLDYLLGWFAVDLLQDDYLTMREYVSCRRITADGVKQNAAVLKKRRKSSAMDRLLPIAFESERTDIARALVELGAKPRICGSTSLGMIRTMIDLGADVSAPGEVPPLVDVVRHGSLEAVQTLLRHGADVSAAAEGRPALFYAATRCDVRGEVEFYHPEIVRALLDAGAQVNDQFEPWGAHDVETILGGAVRGGSLEMVELLLAAGADPHAEDTLRIAIRSDTACRGRRDYIPIIETLMRAGVGVQDVHLLYALRSEFRRTELVRFLLDAGASANGPVVPATVTYSFANTPPLLAAFSFGYWGRPIVGPKPFSKSVHETLEPIAELLLDHGADLQYRWARTAMDKARLFLKGTEVLERMEELYEQARREGRNR